MPALFAPVDPPPLVRYTAVSVLRGAAVVLFFVCWLVLIYHAGLLLQAEWKLARILEAANDFSALPSVHQRELEQVVHNDLAAAGWQGGQVALLRSAGPAGPQFRVARLEVPASEIFPAWSHRLAFVRDRPARAVWHELPPQLAGSASAFPSWWGLD
jgi:hypothetical protein